MGHLPDFIRDLAIILISAGVVTIIFKWLKQPVVLGYIVAGVLVSSHISFFPNVISTSHVQDWSEIGIIFLLFALGLEFSFKKLMDVGGAASIATIINMGSMIVIGYIVGHFLGMSSINSIFLGGMLSMSSTTIIIKAFNDMGLLKTKFSNIVFGMLIVEDLAAILMMVLLSTLSVSQHFEGSEFIEQIFKLVFFMLIWFVVGIYLIPTVLKKLKRFLNDEILLIVAVGLCLGMVLFASSVGFSAALGAFVMGSILAETIESKHIEHLLEPLKNLFGAVFFVSVGMLINPSIIANHIGVILLLTAIVLIGRPIFAALGVVASGQGLNVAIHSGFSLAQIGEFSFIIAGLGMTLDGFDKNLYPIIVAVSVITTFTTPYFIKIANPISNAIERLIPQKYGKLIKGYSSTSYKSVNKQTTWNKLLKSILGYVAIYSILSIAVILIFQKFITPFIISYLPDVWGKILSAALCLLLMAPFMRNIIMKRNRSRDFMQLWNNNNFNRGALISLIVLRVVICLVLSMMVLIPLFPSMTPVLVIISLIFLTTILFSQGFKKQSRRLEKRFIHNLNLKENYIESKAAIPSRVEQDLLSKDIHIEEVEVFPLSPIIGKSLKEINFRQLTGVNVICIIRGGRKINIPDGNQLLYPYDKIIVSGSDNEIQKLIQEIKERNDKIESEQEDVQHHISLSQYVVENKSPMIGKSIGELNVSNKTECMIIEVHRGGNSITDFGVNFIFQQDDVLWLAGEKVKLRAFADNII